jgi:hypothetical protein
VTSLLRRAIAYELGMWRSLYRWVLRRQPALPDGAQAFGSTAAVTPVLWTFIVLSAIEVPVAHLLLPWETVRKVVLALGAYGLIWMIGMLAILRTHPHIVGESGLRVRRGFTVEVSVPWEAIASVAKVTRTLPSSRTVQVERTGSGLVAHIVELSQTNVDVTLRDPMPLPLAKTGGEPVSALRFYADDPAALVARARQHLTADR